MVYKFAKPGCCLCFAAALAVSAQPAMARPSPHSASPLVLLAVDGSFALTAGTIAPLPPRIATPVPSRIGAQIPIHPITLSPAVMAELERAARENPSDIDADAASEPPARLDRIEPRPRFGRAR